MPAELLGHIPETMVYVTKEPKDISLVWDDVQDVAGGKKFTVIPTMAVEQGNKKTLSTATFWAAGYSTTTTVPTKERNNTPFRITVRGLEERERGGRAYKVVDDQNHYFDLREDVLLDALLECGIQKGKIDADFIWARVGSQMKLVRVGSTLHAALVKASQRRVQEKVKTLEPGGIYRNVKGESFLVIGWASTLEYVHSQPTRYDEPSDSVKVQALNKVVVFVELPRWQIEDKGVSGFLKSLFSFNKTETFYTCYIKMQKSLAVMELTDRLELPEGVWESIRGMFKRRMRLDAAEYSLQDVGRLACALSHLANLSPHPSTPAVHSCFLPYHEKLKNLIVT